MKRNDKAYQIRELVDRLGRPSVTMLDEEIAWHGRRKSYRRVALGVLVSMTVTAAMIVLATNLWLAVLQINGSSMNPLLQMDEIVIAVRGSNPERNNVIAFNRNHKLHVKRVIAVAGDRVEIDANGIVSVNGSKPTEPYVSELSLGNCDLTFPYQVPAGTVFVLGDNRPLSLDSRDSKFGPVDREQIIGILKFGIWPLSKIGRVS